MAQIGVKSHRLARADMSPLLYIIKNIPENRYLLSSNDSSRSLRSPEMSRQTDTLPQINGLRQ